MQVHRGKPIDGARSFQSTVRVCRWLTRAVGPPASLSSVVTTVAHSMGCTASVVHFRISVAECQMNSSWGKGRPRMGVLAVFNQRSSRVAYTERKSV